MSLRSLALASALATVVSLALAGSATATPVTGSFTGPTNGAHINGTSFSVTANLGPATADDGEVRISSPAASVATGCDSASTTVMDLSPLPPLMTCTWDTSLLGEGAYTLDLYAADSTNMVALSSVDTINVTIDRTNPTDPANVIDDAATPAGTDTDKLTSTGAMTIAWDASTDGASGIGGYEWCISVAADCTTPIRSGSTGGGATSVLATGTALAGGTTYYSCVRANDGAGNVSAYGCSDGFTGPTCPAGTSATVSCVPLTKVDADANNCTWGAHPGMLITDTAAAETINGTADDDCMPNLHGSDTVKGLAGSDRIIVHGGTGTPKVFAGEGTNYVLVFAGGSPTVYGGNGDDSIGVSSTSSTADITVWFGAGQNHVLESTISNATGGSYRAYFTGVLNVDEPINVGVAEIDVHGGREEDFVDFSRAASASSSAFARAIGIYSIAQTGPITINTGAGNDTVIGSSRVDVIHGGTGNDKISGGGGADKVFGDAGADTLRGGAGNDRLSGGAGNDKLMGDAGNDTVLGGAGRDRLYGGAGRDRLDGGAGFDPVINGGPGVDQQSRR